MAKFPKDFIWGVSTSAYQIEGGWLEGGKGLSTWDVFTHTPGKILNEDKADVACDHYHLYEEDIILLKNLGVKAYRFSIAWARIMPTGYGEINKEGIEFYSKLIDLLIENNIEPWVTLHHWDLPSALELEKDGWLNPAIADYFAEYAKICFEAFGDRVKNWITLNEPWVISVLGYSVGIFTPGRVSTTEPYIAGHNLLRAHGKAAKVYREQFKAIQKGRICVANNCDWREPKTELAEDKAAAERSLEFLLGWFADPLFKGHYPESMVEKLGDRLPKFTEEDIANIKGSCDIFGLNHYSTMYAQNIPETTTNADLHAIGGLHGDDEVLLTADENWKKTTMDWNVIPWGFGKLLKWIDTRYNHPEIYVTENGMSCNDIVVNGKVNDADRIDFLKGYLSELSRVNESGVKVKGYFVWSLLDNFEWASGYSKRFGLYYVDFNTLKRIPKESAKWYKELILKNEI
ncbi:MAG: beta-glucosidase [Ignavibacteriae bacterium]|nr:beta-glucosidase [Ignavibacteriota bacterium]